MGAALLMAALAGSAKAQEDASEKPALWLAADACPSVQLVREMLEPLIGHQRVLRVDAQPRLDASSLAAVRDRGETYLIEVAGVERSHTDPGRDCKERARVAAVFIALNLQTPPPPRAVTPTPEPAPAPTPAPRAPTQAARASAPSLQVGLGAFASVAYAPRDQVAPGGGLELWMRRGIWKLGLSAAVMGRTELAITPSEPGGRVALLRLPARLYVGPMWRVSRFELGPALALALDVLRAQGQGLAENADLWRVNLGAELALQTQLILTETWSISGLLGGTYYPRSYDLTVGPNERSAHTPHFWLTAQLGILCRLR